MRVALICNNARLAQVVLYTLRANGIKPLLICNQRTAASLRSSRLVAGIMFFGDPQAERAAVVDAINRHNRRAPIDLVMSSDVDGLLLLSDIAGEIDPAVFPMSPRAVLERLNNKWTFRALCEELDLSAPPTLFCSSATRLDVDQVAREIGFPAVVKPVAKWASIGMRVVRSAAELRDVISDLEAAPEEIVIQTYIGGCDVGMGLFARSGKVTANCTFFAAIGMRPSSWICPSFAVWVRRSPRRRRLPGSQTSTHALMVLAAFGCSSATRGSLCVWAPRACAGSTC